MQPVRPFLTALLCIIAANGHAPAWFYVARGDAWVVEVASEPFCGHCCHHRHNDVASERSEKRPETPHDSDSCAVCQSLACPLGVTWEHSSTLATDIAAERVEAFFVAAAPELWIAAAHPRGPPILAGFDHLNPDA